MSRKKSFCIIGAGNFGRAIAKAFIDRKCVVTVMDRDDARINAFQAEYPNIDAIKLDTTVAQYLKDQGIENYDVVILTIATELESSLLTAVSLLEAGVKNIIAKARDKRHEKILRQIGLKNVILTDETAGRIIASRALFNIDSDILTIDDEYAVTEVRVEDPELQGKKLGELGLINNRDYNVVHIIRNKMVKLPNEIGELQLEDRILVVSRIEKVNDLQLQFQKIDNPEDKEEMTQE